MLNLEIWETMKKQMKISYSMNTDIFSASYQLYVSIVYFLYLNMDKEMGQRQRQGKIIEF